LEEQSKIAFKLREISCPSPNPPWYPNHINHQHPDCPHKLHQPLSPEYFEYFSTKETGLHNNFLGSTQKHQTTMPSNTYKRFHKVIRAAEKAEQGWSKLGKAGNQVCKHHKDLHRGSDKQTDLGLRKKRDEKQRKAYGEDPGFET
jgi:hypothetical protein